MRIVWLGKQWHNSWTLFRWTKQNEANGRDGSTPDIVRHVADSHVQQLSHGAIVCRSSVRRTQCQRSRPAQYWIFVTWQLTNTVVGFFEPTVHRQRETDGETTKDLLVLRLTSICQHVSDCSQITCTEFHQADGNTSCLTWATHINNHNRLHQPSMICDVCIQTSSQMPHHSP